MNSLSCVTGLQECYQTIVRWLHPSFKLPMALQHHCVSSMCMNEMKLIQRLIISIILFMMVSLCLMASVDSFIYYYARSNFAAVRRLFHSSFYLYSLSRDGVAMQSPSGNRMNTGAQSLLRTYLPLHVWGMDEWRIPLPPLTVRLIIKESSWVSVRVWYGDCWLVCFFPFHLPANIIAKGKRPRRGRHRRSRRRASRLKSCQTRLLTVQLLSAVPTLNERESQKSCCVKEPGKLASKGNHLT